MSQHNESDPMKPVPGYGEKYWCTAQGRMFRRTRDGSLAECSTSCFPPRVRMYYNGKESRYYVMHIVLETWGIELAKAYKEKYHEGHPRRSYRVHDED